MAQNMDKTSSQIVEFSRICVVERLDEDELVERIAANEVERAALAKRFDLISLDRLEAELTLRRVGHGPMVRLDGSVRANLVQSCVVSLEPVECEIEEDFVLHFAPDRDDAPHGHVVEETDVEYADDPPEPLIGGQIDIGEAVAQQLALALDPYPRRPGVTLEDVLGALKGDTRDRGADSPFAVLARLSRKDS
jgi:uncharacterized metal-binding protein YceD (DUF177 family)